MSILYLLEIATLPCKPLPLTTRSFVNFHSSIWSPQNRGSNPVFLRKTGFINRTCVRFNHPAKYKVMQKIATDWLTSILRSTFIPYVIAFEHAAVLIWGSLYSGERDTFDVKYSSFVSQTDDQRFFQKYQIPKINYQSHMVSHRNNHLWQ